MLRWKQLYGIFWLVTPVVLIFVLLLGVMITQAATAYALECQTCHDQLARKTAMGQCESCHEGSDIRLIANRDIALYHKIHFEEEVCYSYLCDQNDADKVVAHGKSLESGGDDGDTALEGWSITNDLPNWNALIDERPLILGSDE